MSFLTEALCQERCARGTASGALCQGAQQPGPVGPAAVVPQGSAREACAQKELGVWKGFDLRRHEAEEKVEPALAETRSLMAYFWRGQARVWERPGEQEKRFKTTRCLVCSLRATSIYCEQSASSSSHRRGSNTCLPPEVS